MRKSSPRPPATRPSGTSDKWFKALDQRRVGSGRLLVTGIHAAGPDSWIQVASADDETRQLILRVSSQTTVDDALQALVAASQRELPTASVLSL